jgi:hypothetical protein
LAKLGVEFGSPMVMVVVVGAAVLLPVVPDEPAGVELAGVELLELLQPDMTEDAITTAARQPGSASVRLICSFSYVDERHAIACRPCVCWRVCVLVLRGRLAPLDEPAFRQFE